MSGSSLIRKSCPTVAISPRGTNGGCQLLSHSRLFNMGLGMSDIVEDGSRP
jgi:hypothetical protein